MLVVEGALHGLEGVGLVIWRELLGEPEEQFFGAASGGNEADRHLHQTHIQLGMRLHARSVEHELRAPA